MIENISSPTNAFLKAVAEMTSMGIKDKNKKGPAKMQALNVESEGFEPPGL